MIIFDKFNGSAKCNSLDKKIPLLQCVFNTKTKTKLKMKDKILIMGCLPCSALFLGMLARP